MRPCCTTSASFTYVSLILCALLLAACTSPPPWRHLDEGTAWKLLAFGESQPGLDTAGWLRLNVRVVQPEGNRLLTSYSEKPFAESGDELWQLLSTRSAGDSILVRFGKSNFLYPNLEPGDTLLAYIGISSYKSVRFLRDARRQEYALLDTLFRSDSILSLYTEYRGVLLRPLEGRGDTLKVRKGKEVVVHYQGRHLDGRIFDDSRRMEGPLRFVYGNEGQVIKGLELAMERMHRHEVAEVILPSWLAFGKKGSADGRVAPYTPVVYRVEVIEVARN